MIVAQREIAIQRDIRAAVTATGRAWLTRNNVGLDRSNGVRYGLGVGSPDLVGGLIPSGAWFALEIKTPIGRLRPEQRCWWDAAAKRGIRGGVARSISEALELLAAAERGEAPRY